MLFTLVGSRELSRAELGVVGVKTPGGSGLTALEDGRVGAVCGRRLTTPGGFLMSPRNYMI